MSTHIEKNDPERWFAVLNGPSVDGLVVFGWAFDVGTAELESGQPTIVTYLTERELETFIDTETGIADYYKNAVLDSFVNTQSKFAGPSTLYEPVIPEDEKNKKKK